ncbi:MAG: 4Fe-4S dicluster domain-containing protein [Paludibacteraceae bacterium]
MLKKIRIGISVVVFILITLLFLDFTSLIAPKFQILANIQFIPALLALNIAVVSVLIFVTLIFGRIYCSSVCPMGVYQDIVGWLSKRLNKRKRYTFSKAKTTLRWTILLVTVVSFLFGFTFLLGLLDPYGAYGRIATHLFRPAYLLGNNTLESIFTFFGHHTFYKVGVYTLSIFSTIVSLLTLVGVGVLAWRNGRTYCNSLCPVGTLLGVLNKFSLFKIRFNEKCTLCGVCTKECKASCIDFKSKTIDYSRCVNCFDCVDVCKFDAMSYSFSLKEKMGQQVEKHNLDDSKRRFLSVFAAIIALVTSKAIGNTATEPFRNKKPVVRKTPIAPPGATTFDKLDSKCVSCHLCVSRCPSHVLKPAFTEYGIGGIMQPVMNFDKGFCNYNCIICTQVCPTGALSKLDKEQKHHTQMGQVQFVIENCIVFTEETQCGACSEHCPTQAVFMVPYKGNLTIPNTNINICVGCGGCEYVCPAKPYKAIYVEGLTKQNTITIKEEKREKVIIDDFGF